MNTKSEPIQTLVDCLRTDGYEVTLTDRSGLIVNGVTFTKTMLECLYSVSRDERDPVGRLYFLVRGIIRELA